MLTTTRGIESLPILPLDVIENIVDILVNDGRGLQSVMTFSLVCQSFLPLCRKHVFSSIRINLSDSYSYRLPHFGDSFAQLLVETPVIAKYIRRLEIRILREPDVYGSQQQSISGNLFDQIPQQLTRLQSLAVWHSHAPHNDWSNNSSSMHRLLQNLIHLPTLIHLDLGWIKNFPISDIIACTNLKHLSIAELHITGEHNEAASSQLHKPIPLQALDITLLKGLETLRLLEATCSDGRPVLDITCLERIGVTVYQKEYVGPTREIIRKHQRLTDIRLEVTDICFRAMEFAKTIMPTLQTLRRVELIIIFDEENGPDPLVGLCDELENVLGKNRLETLEIKIELQTCRTGDEWGRLEKVLLKSGWPTLKHVSLAILVFVYSRVENGPFEMALKNLRRTQFIGLMSSKNLDFRFSVRKEML